ncbi:MAG TPA: fibronectin type III domain-containing protein, partial [Trebonia sp.]|nr:fibronectin type III domain-containing protein [Trebonia sp.]
MNDGLPRRARAAVIGVITLFSVLAVPQLVQAAPNAHASAAASTGRRVTPSGTDASCPAASSSAAASATVSAPAEVRAIGGSGSATVVWCPPASGAASVVSYTVTSSGGQRVTAAVPNDWAIVDGLSDGTSYTFTVTANTKSGASSA